MNAPNAAVVGMALGKRRVGGIRTLAGQDAGPVGEHERSVGVLLKALRHIRVEAQRLFDVGKDVEQGHGHKREADRKALHDSRGIA